MDSILGNISPEVFLAEYWQKKPLLIRNAYQNFESPVSAEELAGLACEEEVESRIVLENVKGKPWQLKNGPFKENTFEKIPNTPWTLLVQSIDHWVPELSALLDDFRFIPNWRLDDIMASYAPKNGSVGPHFDYYDVFLLQASGQRRWKIGQHCDHNSPRLTGTPLRILKQFETTEEWVLNPGDMLYLPPQIAHWGIAENDCITLSIGFRSPTEDEMWASFSDFVCHHLPEDKHLDDPDMALQSNPGEIRPEVIQGLIDRFKSAIENPEFVGEWFGKFITEPKSEHTVLPNHEMPFTDEDIIELIEDCHPVSWNEGSRFCFQQMPAGYLLFCDGDSYPLEKQDLSFVELLCSQSAINTIELKQMTINNQKIVTLLTTLSNKGSLYWEDF